MEEIKPQVDQVTFPDGKKIIVLAKGRLVNLGCATASFICNECFIYQSGFAQIELHKNYNTYSNEVYTLPKHLDEKVVMFHLNKVGAKLTELSDNQAEYIGVNKKGTLRMKNTGIKFFSRMFIINFNIQEEKKPKL